MPEASSRPREDRILVRDGRRHHRPAYSRAEFRIGLGVLAVLAAIVAWVAWRGANPDPALFTTSQALLGDPAHATSADRGPLPGGLAAAGWSEGPVSGFGPENLYEKIDGREDYYKSFGFRRLWFMSLVRDGDATTAVDVEAYDLGEPANALGAFAGERPESAPVDVGARGLALLDRNALYVARGPLYVRAIGSDESAEVRAQLSHLRSRLEAELPGEPLPWAWAVFVGRMGLDPGTVSYTAENAFSFGFARDVWSARLPDETELFVIATEDEGAAAALAARFSEGFAEYGDAAGTSDGVRWVADRYIRTVSGAKALGPWVVGAYGAPDREAAESSLGRLEPAIDSLPLESGAR